MWVDTHDARGRNFGVSLEDFEDWRRASCTGAGMTLVAAIRIGNGRTKVLHYTSLATAGLKSRTTPNLVWRRSLDLP